ncbi:MAG TPA: hypothetical protein DHV85_15450 [Candidatus Accumulibacter sp.]|nr:hypothetical protein [Accumulibacter sp.]
MLELLGEFGSRVEIGNPNNLVVAALEGDPVLLGNSPGHRFFRLAARVRVRGVEVAVGTPRLFGGCLGVLYEGFGFALEEFPGIFEQHAPLVQVAAKRSIRKHRGGSP